MSKGAIFHFHDYGRTSKPFSLRSPVNYAIAGWRCTRTTPSSKPGGGGFSCTTGGFGMADVQEYVAEEVKQWKQKSFGTGGEFFFEEDMLFKLKFHLKFEFTAELWRAHHLICSICFDGTWQLISWFHCYRLILSWWWWLWLRWRLSQVQMKHDTSKFMHLHMMFLILK